MWRACGKEGQMTGLLITVTTYGSVVCSGRAAILYCVIHVYIYTYIKIFESDQTKLLQTSSEISCEICLDMAKFAVLRQGQTVIEFFC